MRELIEWLDGSKQSVWAHHERHASIGQVNTKQGERNNQVWNQVKVSTFDRRYDI